MVPSLMPTESDPRIREVLDSVFRGPEYLWDRPNDPFVILRGWWGRFIEWLTAMEAANPELFRVLYYVVVGGVLALLIFAVWKIVRGFARAGPKRMAGLPMVEEARHQADWHRRQAEQLAFQGDYCGAMRHAFQALLQDLAERKLVVLHPSKTPRDYLRESRLNTEGKHRLQSAVNGLYTVLFGRLPLDYQGYSKWYALTTPDGYYDPS